MQLHFARRPPVTTDAETILGCVDWIALGFEIVHCPFEDWRFRAPDAIAACGVHGLLVVGPKVPVAEIDACARKLHEFTVTLSRDSQVVATGTGANALDSPLLAVGHLIEVLAQQPRFDPVQAGEIVTTGTLTELFPAVPGARWTTQIDGIELPGMSMELA